MLMNMMLSQYFYILFLVMCIIKLYSNEADFLILMETNNFLNITESCQILYNFSTLCHKY